MDIKKQKKAMRAEAKARRADACRAAPDAGDRARDHFLELIGFANEAVVSGYLPVDDEFDVLPLMSAAAERGLRTCLPIVPGKGEPLQFRAWRSGADLVDGVLGIPTPPETAETLTPSLLLIPMLAFDGAGYRLGYGGGFYDRTLALLRAREPGTLAVGVAFAAQRVEAVPRNNLDEPLDWIVTEEGAEAFKRS
jgi:5-formyltetrahydrofolate cyclo-ligase